MSSAEYREYADHCLVLATKAHDHTDKARVLQMAQAWHQLAEKLDNQHKRLDQADRS